MYEKAFSLEIIAPDRVVFRGETTSVSAPGEVGGFQVLYNHAPLLSTLAVGILRVKDKEGSDTLFATGGGFFEVHDNAALVLVDSAERVDQIDVHRAEEARQRAEKRMKLREESVDIARAEAALARALNRLRLATKS